MLVLRDANRGFHQKNTAYLAAQEMVSRVGQPLELQIVDPAVEGRVRPCLVQKIFTK